jgi:hypothetical protein
MSFHSTLLPLKDVVYKLVNPVLFSVVAKNKCKLAAASAAIKVVFWVNFMSLIYHTVLVVIADSITLVHIDVIETKVRCKKGHYSWSVLKVIL